MTEMTIMMIRLRGTLEAIPVMFIFGAVFDLPLGMLDGRAAETHPFMAMFHHQLSERQERTQLKAAKWSFFLFYFS